MIISNAEYAPHDSLYPQKGNFKLPASMSTINSAIILDFYRRITLPEVEKSLQTLDRISNYKMNWDGYNSKKPNLTAIHNAKMLIEKIFSLSCYSNFGWLSPLISADSNGNITFEWWGFNDKKLTFYIVEATGKIEVIQSHNEIIEDMDDRIIKEFTEELYVELFGWLL